MLMIDEEGRKKEASEVKQTTRQSNTAHPRQSLFQRKNELPWGIVYRDTLNIALGRSETSR